MIDASTMKRLSRQYGDASVAVHGHQAKRDVMALVAEVERLEDEKVTIAAAWLVEEQRLLAEVGRLQALWPTT